MPGSKKDDYILNKINNNMKKIKKLFTLITLSAISMFLTMLQVSAQTDTLLPAGANGAAQDTGMRTTTHSTRGVRDSSMLKSSYHDSMRMQRRMMRDTAQMHYRQRAAMKDTVGHLEKPLPPGNATPSKKPVSAGKAFTPDKKPAGKNDVKDKNKNMYLVPDSTLRNDTLK
jgi:hypothetical protein